MKQKICVWCALYKLAVRYGVDPDDDEAIDDFFENASNKLSKFAQLRIAATFSRLSLSDFPIDECEVCHGVRRRTYSRRGAMPMRLSESPRVLAPEGALFSKPKRKK